MRKAVITGVAIIALVSGWLLYITVQTKVPAITSAIYTDNVYGFSIRLPSDWRGYTVDHQEWRGQIEDKNGLAAQNASGPLILISAPDAVKDKQPIPVMIFTPPEWVLANAGNSPTSTKFLLLSAAPVPPGKLGENSKYVFAIPPRYNYAELPGWEKTDAIVNDNSAWSFFEPGSR